jgi:maltose alpha-D-glucosyltransferase/alpha-amylase
MVVANLSRFPQYVELDLATHEGLVPTEIFSNVRFPTIGKHPYLLTLSPHTFFWFKLESISAEPAGDRLGPLRLTVHSTSNDGWRELLVPESEGDLTPLLVRYASVRRWFRSKARVVKEARIVDRLPLGTQDSDPVLVLLELDYVEGEAEVYSIPLVFHRGEEAERREQRSPHAVIARIECLPADGDGTPTLLGTVFDGFATGEAAWSILDAVRGTSRPRGEHGRLVGHLEPATAGTDAVGELLASDPRPTVRAPEIEQSNTVLFVGEKAVLKSYRRIEPGANSELEMGQYMSRHMETRLAPRLLGSLSYEQPGRPPAMVALTQEAVSNEGDAWNLTLDEIELYFDRVLSQRLASPPPGPPASLVEAARLGPPPALQELVGRYFSLARQLGQRTADVHRVLAAGHGDPAFVPEPFTAQHQQSIFQWSHVRLVRLFETLRRRLGSLPPQTRELAAALIPQERTLDDRLRRVVGRKIEVSRIRCHGDLHLGQVLFTGDDFVIIDFEGEPARPTVERRYKRCALRDAMGMFRSFNFENGRKDCRT